MASRNSLGTTSVAVVAIAAAPDGPTACDADGDKKKSQLTQNQDNHRKPIPARSVHLIKFFLGKAAGESHLGQW